MPLVNPEKKGYEIVSPRNLFTACFRTYDGAIKTNGSTYYFWPNGKTTLPKFSLITIAMAQ